MPSQLLSSQKGAEGAGGPRAPQIALSRTHHPAGGPSPKNLKDYVVTIGKALERLNLGAAKREAWESIKKHLSRRDQENETRDAPDAYGIEELRKEIQTLAKTVGKLAEGSKQQSWAQVARPAQLAPQLPARRSREVLVTCDEVHTCRTITAFLKVLGRCSTAFIYSNLQASSVNGSSI